MARSIRSKIAANCVADESRSFVLGLKQEVAQVEAMHEKYSSPPPPIDWASYKEFFDNHDIISKLEKKYEASKDVEVPKGESPSQSFSTSVTPVDPKDIDWDTSWKSYRDIFSGSGAEIAAKQAANTEAKVAMLSEREVFLQENMTTDQTTIEDIFKKYPEIEKEVNDEVANHEWCTNLK